MSPRCASRDCAGKASACGPPERRCHASGHSTADSGAASRPRDPIPEGRRGAEPRHLADVHLAAEQLDEPLRDAEDAVLAVGEPREWPSHDLEAGFLWTELEDAHGATHPDEVPESSE